jgi:chemotaxis protein MotB
MALSRSRRQGGADYWPGFVDALATLVLAVIFLLSVFALIQFYLSQEVTGKDTALQRLSARIAQLTELLSLESTGKLSLEEQVAQLRAGLAGAESERDRYRGLYEGLGSGTATAQGKISELSGQLGKEQQATLRALAQVEILNQQIAALRRQLGALEQALEITEQRDRDSQTRIAELGQRLNVALAQRVQELSRYRSDFFGRLRSILGNRPDIRVVGDRFVLQSEVFFDTGRSELKPEGRAEIDKIAAALSELDRQIPQDIPWVLRVDGHTDVRPTGGGRTNWDLSSARAASN